ncbi:hypothetical protein [Maricaulis sp.]|uniref:hypothetical protein n=1 Tax=Maricaulis sp. TaxID=1486257 RepID=UPI0026169F67|nr:hypothetical protein [Maricaulis sp.]
MSLARTVDQTPFILSKAVSAPEEIDINSAELDAISGGACINTTTVYADGSPPTHCSTDDCDSQDDQIGL